MCSLSFTRVQALPCDMGGHGEAAHAPGGTAAPATAAAGRRHGARLAAGGAPTEVCELCADCARVRAVQGTGSWPAFLDLFLLHAALQQAACCAAACGTQGGGSHASGSSPALGCARVQEGPVALAVLHAAAAAGAGAALLAIQHIMLLGRCGHGASVAGRAWDGAHHSSSSSSSSHRQGCSAQPGCCTGPGAAPWQHCGRATARQRGPAPKQAPAAAHPLACVAAAAACWR
jgi:hypothetical protein